MGPHLAALAPQPGEEGGPQQPVPPGAVLRGLLREDDRGDPCWSRSCAASVGIGGRFGGSIDKYLYDQTYVVFLRWFGVVFVVFLCVLDSSYGIIT